MDERYQNGKIYRLTCDDPTMVYYGSTMQTLKQRLWAHNAPKKNECCCKKMRDIGGLQIHLVEDYPCNSRRELSQREQYYIDNNDCINIKRAFSTKEQTVEYNKAYHKWYITANKDKINQKNRERYQTIKKIK